ncbi:GGDEF domain-containing protein [Enterobacter kobei]|uniref:diguanylate cyclase n=3 Tax=Enterobacter kobei TaxID=208224 RepID=A0AA86IN91_9ENTR|nr:hypothetical protein BH713_15355 [Enterobacter kobei]BCU54635.1 GGDEF domain-containing protein [Enterobacter kobei]
MAFLAGALFYIESTTIIYDATSSHISGFVRTIVKNSNPAIFILARQLCITSIIFVALLVYICDVKGHDTWLKHDSIILMLSVAWIILIYIAACYLFKYAAMPSPVHAAALKNLDYARYVCGGLNLVLFALIVYYNDFNSNIWNSVAALTLTEMLCMLILYVYGHDKVFAWNMIRGVKVTCRLVITIFIIYDALATLKKVCHMKMYDALTKAYNRSYFLEEIEALLTRKNKKDGFCILLMDLDKFKAINDTFGHQKGDTVLQEFAQVIHNCIGSKDIFARLGGDEFAVILPSASENEAQYVADNICKNVANISQLPSVNLPNAITTSIGIYHSNGSENVKEIIGFADLALYEAKREGRNRSIVFDESYYSLTT